MPFPVVPIAPGVPPLIREPGVAAPAPPDLMDRDETVGFGAGLRPQWGLYLGGRAVITADTVTAFDYKGEEVVADFPLERGSFQSYDKVDRPYEARVQFVAGGTQAAREALLLSVAAALPTLDLYNIVTPEVVYVNANMVRYDYRRTTTNGVGMIVVDVMVQEVRVQGATTVRDSASPSGADPLQGGNVQPTAPTGNQSSAATAAT